MMTFTSTLRGYKRRMHKKVGVPVLVPVVSSSRFKLTSPRVPQWVLAPG